MTFVGNCKMKCLRLPSMTKECSGSGKAGFALSAGRKKARGTRLYCANVLLANMITGRWEVITTALMCLALTIYHEARGEPLSGQIAVAQVVVNRVRDPEYPKDICSVVHQGPVDKRGNPLRDKCQFRWYCDGKSDKAYDRKALRRALAIATLVMRGAVKDKARGATHFHTQRPSPERSLTFIAKIGEHILYR